MTPTRPAEAHAVTWPPAESAILVGVGHHSYLRIGSGTFFWYRSSYDPDLAALFSESDRYLEEAPPGGPRRKHDCNINVQTPRR